MSNSSIVDRLHALGEDYAYGRVSSGMFASQLQRHSNALEGMQYVKIIEAQLVCGQLLQAMESGREQDVDRQALAGSAVPVVPP